MNKTNILFWICDDLAYGDLSAHGNPYTHTVNLDRLHAESFRLERHCSGPLCSPARASLMTGRYHMRTGVIDTYCGRSIMHPDEKTLANYLQDADYTSGAFGKWHLGDCYPSRAMDFGFEETLLHNAGGIAQPGDLLENYQRGPESYFDGLYLRNGAEEKSSGYCTDVFTDAAMDFMKTAKETDEPFFCYIASNAPHSPLIVDEKWSKKFNDLGLSESFANVYGMVENIDWNIGRLLDFLDEQDLADDTLVIFTSDHGPCSSAKNDAGESRFNCELRDIKGTLYEGGIRVPVLMRHKNLKANSTTRFPTSPIDYLPTILDICGIETELKNPIDGLNLKPWLDDEQHPVPEREIYMQWHRGDRPVRYKNAAVIEADYKYYAAGEDELYKLAEDPHEERNLAQTEPEKLAELKAKYDSWFNDVGATRGTQTYDAIPIHIGTEHEPLSRLTLNDARLKENEGWLRDDLSVYWAIKNCSTDAYEITVRFKKNVPSGTIRFSFQDVHLEKKISSETEFTVFEEIRLPIATGPIEAYLELDVNDDSAYLNKLMHAFHVEFKLQ
ncbi:MAG: arylsulfatase [Lentisphaeria bacterium]|nr:arylsulfatase [Lentisphaeria bacterium]NQZ69746.1 arylsulfatase [Lentisphaeria bacterium]